MRLDDELVKLQDRLDDIEGSHRLGPINNRRNLRPARINALPIILRFNYFRKRQEVFKAKLSENRTKHRYEIYKVTVTKYGRGKVAKYS